VSVGAPVRVSVVVPAHAAGPGLEACLRSIAAADPPPLETILACDGPVAGAEGLAAATGCALVHRSERPGAAATRNAGAWAAAGDVVLFLDSDVVVPPDLVGRVVSAFAEMPGLTAVIGSYDDDPAAPALVSQYRNLLHHYVHQTSRPEAASFWGACGAVRRSALVAVGGFDESYPEASVEDIELGVRLRSAGGVLRLDRGLQVKHLKRWTLVSFLRTDLFQRALPWARVILRERCMPDDLNLRTRHRVSAAVSTGLALVLVPAVLHPGWRLAAAGLAVTFVLLNRDFLLFLWRRRGPALALAAVPLHLLHNLAGIAGFALALAGHLARRRVA
jgi:glycosyltransferase involved in cell wall biosynthesis